MYIQNQHSDCQIEQLQVYWIKNERSAVLTTARVLDQNIDPSSNFKAQSRCHFASMIVAWPTALCSAYNLLLDQNKCSALNSFVLDQNEHTIQHFTSTLVVMSHKINACSVFALRRISALHM